MDTNLYLFSETSITLDVDGVPATVLKWEVRSLLTQHEFIPVFDWPSSRNMGKPSRVILPMFQYDERTQTFVGEEGSEPTTLDERMVEVVRHYRETGLGSYTPADIEERADYVHVRLLLAGYEGHIMGCIPKSSKAVFMVKANIIRPS
jgi:hypothetical protein